MSYTSSAYASEIDNAASANGVPANLLGALLEAESGLNPDAVNGNAVGIAQFMPGTAAEYGVDRANPDSSINGAAAYLSNLYSRTGSWLNAVTAYGTVPSTGAVTNGQKNVAGIASSLDAENGATSNLQSATAGSQGDGFILRAVVMVLAVLLIGAGIFALLFDKKDVISAVKTAVIAE